MVFQFNKFLVNNAGLTDEATFTVEVSEVNRRPTITAIPDQTIVEGVPFEYQVVATDPDRPNNNLAFSLVGALPTGIAITPTGLITWTPGEAQGPGTYAINVRATDDGTPSLFHTVIVNITVNEDNQTPTIAAIPDQITDEGVAYQYQVVATDPDGPSDILSYSLEGTLPGGIAIDSNGLVTWTPNETQGPGTYTITVTATDSGSPGLSATETFEITVSEVNQAPVITPIPEQAIDIGTLFEYQVLASDPDLPANSLTYSLDVKPAGALIDPQTGVISWTPNVTSTETFFVRVTDEGELFATTSFLVAVSGNLLAEDDRFVTELSRTLVLPNDASAVRVTFQAPEFDTTAQQSIRDAFEIEVTDTAGNPLSFPYASSRDAVYNWSENLQPTFGVGTTATTNPAGQDSTATINLSGLPIGTEVVVTARLVNNDFDTGTVVRIQSFDVVDANGAAPTGFTPTSVLARSFASVNINSLSDITASFSTAYGRTTLAGDNRELATELIVTNQSNRTVTGRLLVAIDNISEPDAHAMRPDGFLPDGRPYFDLTAEMNGEALAPGESLQSREIRFLNDSSQQFSYRLSVLGEVNTAPTGFNTTPLAEIEADRTYRYQSRAVDPENQTLTYSVVSGPEALTMDPATGLVTWATTAADIGQNQVTLRATDPYGLFVEQTFDIQVFATLQNRPPVFVSTPETEAIAGSGFEVSTVQAGENPVGVAVANIGLDDGTLVTINRGNQTLSQITALGNDLYELPLELTVGEPGPVDQILRSGYNIDVGLPPYLQQAEGNSIRGMDQADLNGDGLLDIVISAQVQQRIPSTVYTQVINVVFGEGDGKFSAPVNLASITTNNASNPRTLKLGDFDQNGTIDVLALNINTSSLYLLRGAGDGTFSPVEVMPIATPLNDFKTVDLNQDGILDLIGATSDTRSLGYMLGQGDGTFATFTSTFTSTNQIFNAAFPGRNYATSDMDGDGDIDIIFSHFQNGTVNVLANDGNLNFSLAASLVARRPFGSDSQSASLYSIFVGDFNGDSLVDIAYGAAGYTSNDTGSLGMFIRDSSGFTFTYQNSADTLADNPGNWAGNSEPIDIDGDGDLDILVSGVSTLNNFSTIPSVLRNRGDGTFTVSNLSLPFAEKSPFETTHNRGSQMGILAGDYNGDGMLDLVAFKSENTINSSTYSTVSVILADRPGEFASSDTLTFLTFVNSPQVFFESGDFNNDGIVDLWSPAYQGTSKTWLGRGDGTFEEPKIATPAIGNEGLSKGFVGDFDKDGNLDVFWRGNGGVQNGPGARLLAALGNGDGTFTRTFTLPYSHSAIVSADFNGDGYIDFATRNFGTAIDVYLYDVVNPGTWLPAYSFAFSSLGPSVGDYRASLTVEDFNQDGKSDLAAVYRLSGGEVQIAVLSGLGDGTFASPISSPYGESVPNYSSPAELTSGDLNEDGIADLVVYDSLAIGVHLGVGDGTFGTPFVIPANDPRQLYGHVFVKDFDYDGHQDILFTSSLNQAQLSFLRGDGKCNFEERVTYAPPIESGYVEFGDLDNDGRDEVIVSDPSGTNFVSILYAARERLTDIVTADLNGDGNDDVLATNFDNSRVKWFLGDNLGHLVKQPDLLTDNGPVGLIVENFNQDATSEIVTVNRSGRSVSVFSKSVGAYTRTDISVGRTPIAVTSAFVDADNSRDLLVLDEGLNTVWYLQGNNNLTFATPVPVLLGDRPNDVIAGDVNSDGFTDIVVSLPDSNRLMILPGDGTGNFATPVYIALPGSPTAIGWSDFNQDGRADFAVTIGELDQVAILYGRGQLQFASPQAILVGDQPVSLQISDADGDGRDDIIVANSGDDTASVIFNRFDPTQVYRYDALAIDPDDDTVSYELLNAPGGMILDAETGQITWAASAEQIGSQWVTIQASDGLGGLATQTFNIDVAPARENHDPLISSVPETVVSADEPYSYSLRAVDTDNDSLRYRLLEGPDGATIDPITGQVTWDARQAAQRTNRYTQMGQGQVLQNFVVPATPALQPASVTAEGWFKFERALGTSETLIRKTNGFSGVSYQLSFVGTVLRATVGATTSSSANVFVNYNLDRESGRWYHLAMTFDDSTKKLALFVDGQEVGSTTANLTMGYANGVDVLIAGPGSTLNGEVGSVRIWNEAHSQALVQQLMSAEADATDSSLVLDLDFDAIEAQTLRDKSSYQHVAYRVGSGNIYAERTTGLAFSQTAPFVVSVEDGRGGYDQQSFDVTYLPPLKGSISGTLFDDQNSDAVQQVGEAGLTDWLVYVDSNGNQYPDPSETSTITGPNGQYAFSRLLPGNYPIRVQPRAGYETPAPSSVNVLANQDSVVDFAINELALGQIRGQVTTTESDVAARWKVFADLDDNGVLDAAEPFALTDDLGQFAIAGLDAGDYRVRAEMLPGWQVTSPTTRVLDVTLAADAIDAGNDFVVTPSTTTASSGLQFVTVPNLSGASDSVIAGATYRYDALAIGLLGQDVSYDLSLAPDGIFIDAATGFVLWRPSLTQVGEQRVILRAMDSLDGIALQDFTLNVAAPNTAPTITSTAPSIAYVGVEARYSIQAQDAENDTLTYALVSGPATVNVDSLSGKLTWTPSVGETGLTSIIVSVADTFGNVTQQSFDITVSSATPTTTPFLLSPLRTQAAINQAYRSQVLVFDAIGRELPVSLVSGPSGLAIDSDGNVAWTPATSQLGAQTLVVSAVDGLGNSQQFTIDLSVTQRLVNTAPQITSDPAVFTVANQQYVYGVVAVDAENDQLDYQLLEAPVGMSINNSTGTVRWLPNRELVGEHAISIQVTDAAGASTLQSYQLRVRTAGGPPQITSVPPTEAAVGTAWLYTVLATDVERDPLTYSLLAGPDGVVIDSVTGELSWTPRVDQLGLNTIAIQVSDGSGGSTSQSFAIRVTAGVPNLPPTISTAPNRFAAVGSAYTYSPTATDPEGQAIVYSLRRAPATMTVNPSTGQLNWTPSATDVGKVVVTLVATDTGGAAAVQSFELDVLAANQTPTIISSPSLSIAAGAMWRYSVVGRDADLDPLRYEMLESPANATINAFGEVQWLTSVADIGTQAFRFRVSDPRGGVVEQSFTLEVVADTVAPRVTVLPDKVNPFPWGGPIHVYVSAVDNVGVSSVTLTVNGIDVPLDANRHAALYVEDWGYAVLNIVATATDAVGNVGVGTGITYYNDPEVDGDVNAPMAEITSPVESASVTGFVDIQGTAAGSNFSNYRLLYRRVDQPESSFVQFATSTTAITDGVLGKWDTTLLNNDEYIIRLEVSNQSGRTNILDRQVGLSGDLKLGNFQLSFTDMVIPVAGIPIEITRIYDTLQADREGDFGYGWRLEYRDTDLRVGLPKSGLEDTGIYTPLRAGVKVYLNVPGQGRQGFTFTPEIRVLPGFGDNLVVARPKFTPDRGVTSTLSTGTGSYLYVNEQGELFAPGGIPYNPASPNFGGAFILGTSEGITYRVDGASGKLQAATDRNGNRLTFTEAGITYNAGIVAVAIARDATGRITRITDPDGNATTYRYSNGDLTASTDREGSVTTFAYHPDLPHYLTEVTDPLGRVGQRTVYDTQGRLTRLIGEAGSTTEITFDPANFLTSIIDPAGNEVLAELDSFGNVISTTDALGNQVRSEFDAAGNMSRLTQADGSFIAIVYDANRNPTSLRDALGNTIYATYDAAGNRTSYTDAIGNTTTFRFDASGRVVAQRDAAGNVRQFSYDARGALAEWTDERGIKRKLQQDARGRIVAQTDGLGHMHQYSYNASGSELSNSTTRTDINGIVRELSNSRAYDRNQREVSAANSLGQNVSRQFDAAGDLISQTSTGGLTVAIDGSRRGIPGEVSIDGATIYAQEFDSLGRVSAIVGANQQRQLINYDAAGRIIGVSNATAAVGDSTVQAETRYEYDAAHRLTAIIDANGHRTELAYDAAGNRVSIQDPLGNVTRYTFDANGRNTSVIDPQGRVTQFDYDRTGNVIAINQSDGTSLVYHYDAVGNRIETIDEQGGRTRNVYDAENRLVAVVDSAGGQTRYRRDELGNIVESIDALGRSTLMEYDDLSRLIAVTRPLGQRSQYAFNAEGDLASYTDFTGQVDRFTHDSTTGRLSMANYGDQNVSYEYDTLGQIVKITDPTGDTTFEYDVQGRMLSRTLPNGDTLRYEYDLVGNITAIITPHGTLRQAYDALNRLVLVVDPDGAESRLIYDSLGRLVEKQFGNGTVESLGYDGKNLLISQVIRSSDGDLLASTIIGRDVIGNVIAIEHLDGLRASFQYDQKLQLIRETIDLRSGETIDIEYRYDAVGNRIERRHTTEGITQYTYDANDRLIAETNASQISYIYDDNGNLINKSVGGIVTSYTWDNRDRLVTVVTDGTTVEYRYDDFGLRTNREVNGEMTEFLFDTSQSNPVMIAESTASEAIIYVYAGSIPISYRRATESTYVHPNFIGTVNNTTDREGQSIDSATFDAFGNLLDATIGYESQLQFAGEYRDSTTGLAYHRARHLDTSNSRFLSPDPFAGSFDTPVSLHRYLYANNSPALFSDPSGNISLAEKIQVVGIIGGLAALSIAAVQQVTGLGSTVNWSGGSASITIDPKLLDKARGQTTRPELFTGGSFGKIDVGLSVGIQINVFETKNGLNLKSNAYDAYYFGASATLIANISFGRSSALPIGFSVGTFDVALPQFFVRQSRYFQSIFMSGPYLLIDGSFSIGPTGKTPKSFLQMGFAQGNADGIGFNLGSLYSAGITITGGITLPVGDSSLKGFIT